MRKILISLAAFFAASSVWACDYTISLDMKVGATTICVDGVQFKQLKENYYQVRFSNYFPGTKISYQKINFHFNGQKESIEQEIMILDKILRTYDIGNLYFSYEMGFTLIPNPNADRTQVENVSALLKQINTFVH